MDDQSIDEGLWLLEAIGRLGLREVASFDEGDKFQKAIKGAMHKKHF